MQGSGLWWGVGALLVLAGATVFFRVGLHGLR